MPKFAKGGLVGGTVNRALAQISQAEGREDFAAADELRRALKDLYDITEEQVGILESQGADSVMGKEIIEDAQAKKDREEAIKSFQDEFTSLISTTFAEALKTGNIGGALKGFVDTITNNIINNFADGLANAFVKNIDFGKMFSSIVGSAPAIGGQSGSVLTGIGGFLSGVLGFSQGGVVPTTKFSQAGKDSVPAMLMPGEVVLSKNDVRNMQANTNGGQAVYNINVSGDVSRQTRKEIVKMIPQITNGVNAQNKEVGRRT